LQEFNNVGRELSKPEMKKILVSLSELSSPWNCPHGRPSTVICDFNEKEPEVFRQWSSLEF
jgi:DNA mismatch repair ATPase MutL